MLQFFSLTLLNLALSVDLAAQSVCRAADHQSDVMISIATRYATATANSGETVVRDSLRIPSVPAKEISLVTSNAICSALNTAYQSDLAGVGSGFTGHVYVVKIGNRNPKF